MGWKAVLATIALGLFTASAAGSVPCTDPSQRWATKRAERDRWIFDCDCDHMTDRWECVLRVRAMSGLNSQPILVTIKPNVGIIVSGPNRGAAIRIDDKLAAKAAYCLGQTCVFSREDTLRLLKEMSEGKQFLVRSGTTAASLQAWVDLGPFKDLFGRLIEETGPMDPPKEAPSDKSEAWRERLSA